MLEARRAQHKVELVEVDPAELGIDAATRALGKPGGDFRTSPEAAIRSGTGNRFFELLLLGRRQIGLTTTRIEAVLVTNGVRSLRVVTFAEGANPVAMEADEFGHLADGRARAKEPQRVPTAHLFRVVARTVALFQLFRAQVRCQSDFWIA